MKLKFTRVTEHPELTIPAIVKLTEELPDGSFILAAPINPAWADTDYVIRATGMEPGSFTPLGLPADWHILIQKSFNKRMSSSAAVFFPARSAFLLLC